MMDIRPRISAETYKREREYRRAIAMIIAAKLLLREGREHDARNKAQEAVSLVAEHSDATQNEIERRALAVFGGGR